ncbi:MAG TPA: response regulator transcription factor [Baekduia sp.]|jgi:DNA-binding NarL/FixJ family response regulator|nr:response regulator transcription factor [Baekduia sp.]
MSLPLPLPIRRADQPIRALVGQGNGLVRTGLCALLTATTDVEIVVVGSAGTSQDVEALALRLRPDVAVIDAAMPGLDGPELTRRIRAAGERIRVLVLLPGITDSSIFGVLRAGAVGVLSAETGPDDLVRAVLGVAAGEAVLAPEIAQRLIEDVVARPQRGRSHPEQLQELTDREREVMALVAAGLSNGEIAAALVISPATAKTHVSRAMVKLHAHDRAQLAVLAYQTGLVFAGGARAAAAAAHRITGRLDAQQPFAQAA